MDFKNDNLLGKNSYPQVVKAIYERISQTNCETNVGNELCKDVYKKLNESNTPIIELKAFQTKAEKIAPEDTTLKDLLTFITKQVTTGDLNFIINLVKEEHFSNLKKLNHPSPEQTINSIREEFDQPASIIEEAIKAGLFDTLQSDLLKKVKTDLQVKTKKLNESAVIFNGNIAKYAPVGIRIEDVPNNKTVFLTESCVLGFDRETKKFVSLSESEYMKLDISDGVRRIMTAINSCNYNPENEVFSLNESWDFDLRLQNDGETTVNGKPIKKEDVRKLLLESVKTYTTTPGIVDKFNKMDFLRDADNFIMLVENSDQLIKLDKIGVLKNLSESNYVLFDVSNVLNNKEPRILASSNHNVVKLFESYAEFTEAINTVLNTKVNPLFESQLTNETGLINFRNQKIVELNENQKVLNQQITKVKNLKTLAEPNSPALIKLNEQENILSENLDKNLKSLNEYKNEFQLYK